MNNVPQNRVRLGFGIAYTFGEGGTKEAAEAKRKADAELTAAEARKKAMEQAECEECKRDVREKAAEAKRKADAELAAAEAQKKAMEEADRQKQALRARVLEHFSRVLPTTDTPRGLIVNMGDALFVASRCKATRLSGGDAHFGRTRPHCKFRAPRFKTIV